MGDVLKVLGDDNDNEIFEERYELMKSKVNSLIEDWKVRDYPKDRGLEIHVITRKPNFKDVWREKYVFDENIVVFFTAEIGTKKEGEE